MAKFNSARLLRRYGKCQSLNEIIKAARTDSARKPNVKRRIASTDSTQTPQYQGTNTSETPPLIPSTSPGPAR